MATYTYKCSDCGEVFDVKASIKEKEEGKSEKFTCPKCQSKNIKQEFSAVNFVKNVFKGSEKTDGSCCGDSVCDTNPKSEEKDCCGSDTNKSCC
ncbi:MAG: zinc ribbon domain-containing protein [bacterium]|nr:zinc ribbon domain-containing protein [bacterium]